MPDRVLPPSPFYYKDPEPDPQLQQAIAEDVAKVRRLLDSGARFADPALDSYLRGLVRLPDSTDGTCDA